MPFSPPAEDEIVKEGFTPPSPDDIVVTDLQAAPDDFQMAPDRNLPVPDRGGGGRGIIPMIGQGLAVAGKAVKDVVGAYGYEATLNPEDQAKQLGISDEAIKKLNPEGLTRDTRPGVTPLEEDTERLPLPAKVLSKAAYGLVESAPKLAGVAALQAGGVPAPIAAGAIFGTTPEGFNPKDAAVAAALPFVGKYAGAIVGSMAKKFGVDTATALNWWKGAGAITGAAGYAATINESEIQNLPPEQQTQARIDSIAGLVGQSMLGPMGTEKTTPGEVAATRLNKAIKSTRLGESPLLIPETVRSAAKVMPEAAKVAAEAISEQPTTTEVPNASGQQTATAVHGDVQSQPGQGQGQVPVEEGSQGVQPPGASGQGQVPLTKEIGDLSARPIEDFGKMAGVTDQAWALGDRVTDQSHLDALKQAEIAAHEDFKKQTDPIAKAAALKKRQFFNEAARRAVPRVAATESGWSHNPESQYGGMKAEGLPQEAIDQLEKQWEFTDRRKGSQTEGTTLYVPENSPKADILKAIEKKTSEVVNARKSIGKEAIPVEKEKGQEKGRILNQSAGGQPLPAAAKPVDRPVNNPNVPVPPKTETQPAAPARQVLAPGPGAATATGVTIASDVGAMEHNLPPLEQLADAVRQFPKQKGNFGEKIKQWLDNIGIPAKDKLTRTWAALRAVPAWLKEKATTLPAVDDLDRRVGQWNAQDWTGSEAARKFSGAIREVFQDRSKLRALSNWINAGGDLEVLRRQADATTDPALRKTYEDALKFGPDEQKLARAVRQYHDEMLNWGRREGVLAEGVENYLHRYYRPDDPALARKLAAVEYLKFSKDFNGFKKRYYESDFEAEQAGLKPEKDAGKRILAYDHGFRQALTAREFVRKSFETNAMAKDGRPELVMAGGAIQLPEGEGKDVTLIKPRMRKNSADPDEYTGDYARFHHPAFQQWKYAATDTGGKPIIMQGDILVHPDFANKYAALFEKSWWGKTPARRALMDISSFVKQTMLLGPFHLFQITTGGIEHRINPFKLLEITPNDPAQQRMAEAGLFANDSGSYSTEGVGGGGLLDKIPIAGEYFQRAKEWLFQDYIPRWKMTLALSAEARNMERYRADLASGKITPEQVTRMSARQSAAVFGGQNQRAIFRSKTFQDTLRMLFLAPDFGEERLRQVAQATGKYGHEQRAALVAGALGMMVLAKLTEQALTGRMNLTRPFTVTKDGKEYGMRNPASDIYHFITDPVGYLRNRLNPIYTRPLLELATGRDQFGRKRTAGQELKDEVKQIIPLPARGLVEKQQTLVESLLNSTGITEHRKTAFADEMQKVNKWKESKGYTQPGEFIYDPDKDPYHPLTTQLSLGNDKKIGEELDKSLAGKNGAERAKVLQHYRRSLATQPHLTGSRKREAEYLKTLGPKDRADYQEAVQERRAMWQRFQRAWSRHATQPAATASSAVVPVPP